MKRLAYLFVIILIVSCALLIVFSPDAMAMGFSVIMLGIVAAGLFFGIMPAISLYGGLRRGQQNIERALDVQTDSAWTAVMQLEPLFYQKTLDSLFDSYREKIQMQRDNGQIMGNIEEFLSEDVLALRCWNNVMNQIPGTLTGLGLLGTFVGLLMGINEIAFSTVDAALNSVQLLLDGIRLAFYTSISGVILSILFNILHNMIWNLMVRELGLFTEYFHRNVIPTAEEQERYQRRRDQKLLLERLDRIPKAGGFSIAAVGSGAAGAAAGQGNEQILMPQILEGIKKGEFVFYLQPRYDLNTRKIVAAESLVRWQHPKLGMVSPAVFLPILEANGYITKLDQFIWENVCKTIREWIDAGERPVPISLNITKTDMLAIDIASFFEEMIKKYRIPPRFLELEIAINAFIETHEAVVEASARLRQFGFRVILDGFSGDFVGLSVIESLNVDELKLDLRQLDMQKNAGQVKGMFDQARQMKFEMFAEGIETMEQVSLLRKSGCTQGQGYYFSKPVSLADFKELMKA